MTLTLGSHKSSCTYLFNYMYTYIHITGFNLQLKNLKKGTKFDLVKKIKVTPSHHLNKFGSTRAINAAYQVSRSSAFWFQRGRF